jgi:SlyX protein
MTPESLEELETKLAFLDRANTELSDVVARQQKEIDLLRAELRSLASRLDDAQPEEQPWTAEEEKPPHY